MRFRQLGASGLTVSKVGLGTSNFATKLDGAGSRVVVHAALDAGITLFDTSDSYGPSEERLGAALGKARDDVVIATKFGNDVRARGNSNGEDWGVRGSRRYVRRSVENSLRRLGTDWIDLYQMHSPDPASPIEETLSTLDDLVREGKVRYLGSSNFAGWQVADAEWVARTRNLERFVSAQNNYSLLDRAVETDLVPALDKFGIGLLPYYPLASGLLAGKHRRGEAAATSGRGKVSGRSSALTDDVSAIVEALAGYAAERSIGLLDVAVGGLAAQPSVASVIAGASSPGQVVANVAAGEWEPTAADLAELDEVTSVPI